MEIKRLHVGARLSEVAIHNGVVYLAGQIPEDISQGITGQTREVLDHVERLLQEAGSHKSRILSCQIFLSDISLIAEMNLVWDAWVTPGNTPPRATVEARLANPDWLIEVVVIAAQN
ncbi:RidA family protein [Undibacterium oligocarboniphilum]|uniref:RidA family protein n=1 Tax=Undibacterium oligocarboniphilum TaxID=666702 RepID=A0A850QLG6_9BURK|nr:RidA family protein [Undibacterium oligocarboniphilum]MBC3869006.1 RidA family protein [Undibacterium oligocarboniphilum]NVO76986.1 RidA family protein [Undibacterium oligocarboniphilum]